MKMNILPKTFTDLNSMHGIVLSPISHEHFCGGKIIPGAKHPFQYMEIPFSCINMSFSCIFMQENFPTGDVLF